MWGGRVLKNTDCTVYRYVDGGYMREYIPECFWHEVHGVKLSAGGFIATDEVYIYISEEHAAKAPETAQKDIVIKGNCPFAFDNTSDATVSAGLRKLKSDHSVVTVISVSDKRYGEHLRHIKVVCK